MKLYIFPPSGRVVGIMALKNHLALDCEVAAINLRRVPIRDFPEIMRWYKGLAALSAWQDALAARAAALAEWASNSGG